MQMQIGADEDDGFELGLKPGLPVTYASRQMLRPDDDIDRLAVRDVAGSDLDVDPASRLDRPDP